MKPTVVFVDGPTGVGKDYFISELTNLYTQAYPQEGVRIIRAADIILNKEQTRTEERKYTTYQTTSDKAKAIFEGHIELLKVISSNLKYPQPPGLIMVNRGFLSYLHYNVYQQPWAIREQYIQTYASYTKSLLKNLQTVSVVIKPPQAHQPLLPSDIQFIINRLLSRADSKPIDEVWLKDLYERYEKVPVAYSAIFDKNFTLHSGQAKEFVDSLFLKQTKSPQLA